ncbi:eCIS core domain-containing protein [Rhodopila sp.]|uniref:eCIS core domain-containing protein n=1 Tax=Rhodopila sp. TaxID=2480087 RepID=UPI002B5992AB|nr:DUF4157 domain-containing protein [Rhodopila sp.]HVZ08886.1 DUF4157 domain-containing protein [Rhodopila sp.]
MSAAAQAVRPTTRAAGKVRRRDKTPPPVLGGSPRYLRAGVRLGGTHDPEEHEAEQAASTISAGGCHRVVDPGGSANLRATGASGAASTPAARPSAPADPANQGVRAATHAGTAVRASSGPTMPEQATPTRRVAATGSAQRAAPAAETAHHDEAHGVARPSMAADTARRSMAADTARRSMAADTARPSVAADTARHGAAADQTRAMHGRVIDPGASGRIRSSPAAEHPQAVHAKPAPRVTDPGGTAALRAMVAAPVTDPGAAGRIRRTAHVGPVRSASGPDADRHAADRIETARAATGRPLPSSVKTRLEHGFGQTLDGVRVHTGEAAHAAAASIGARAYTEGERITLGHGESEHDLHLMAHETAHVVQNRRAATAPETRRKVQPAPEEGSDGGRTYRMLDGRTIELPDDMTAAEAHQLEMDGMAAKRRLGLGPPPKPVPDGHKPAEKGKKKPVKPVHKTDTRGPGRHHAGPHSAGVTVKLHPGGSVVARYLTRKAAPVLAHGVTRLAALSLHQQTHADAGTKVKQAEHAVIIPESDGQSKSNFGQVSAVAVRPPPQPDPGKAKRELTDSLAANIPATIEDVDNFKRDKKAQHTGADVLKVVQTDKNAVVATFGDVRHTPPPQPPEHLPVPLPPAEAAPPTGALNLGQGAVPAPLPEHTDVSEYTDQADARLKEEGVTQEQLDMVDSGDLAEANKTKKGLEKAAATQPAAVQDFARDAASKADQDLRQQEKAERAALANHRRQGLHRTGRQQTDAKAALEKKREEVAAKINAIYQTAQDSVTKKLADLETQSMQRFDDGNAQASKTFEDGVHRELEAYKDDRYSGVFGWARRAKDWVLGMDDLPRVKEIFETNRGRFVTTINKLVDDISADNRRVVDECKEELAKARTDIKTFVDKLGPELKDIANKTAGEVSGRLDELDGFIRKKEEELQQKLADKQQAAIKAIDDKIQKMKEEMSGALAKLGNLLLWAAKKFFTWALGQFGYSLSDIESIIDKGVAVLKAIFTKPIQFVKNLIGAAKLGFMNFGGNFLTHLKDSVFEWLTGSLEGITLPKSWDLPGIASVALQILGLTWTNIRGKLVSVLGEPVVKSLESGFDLVVTLVRDGPMAAWEKIQEMGDEIKQAFIQGVQDFIQSKIVQKAIETIISLFAPAAGIIRAIIGIYDTIVFFIQKAKQIIQMVGNFLSSISEIVAGNIAAAADALEKGLARGLTLVITFLARFLHLDGITEKIRVAIGKLRAKVDKMLDKVVTWIADKARKAGKWIAGKLTRPDDRTDGQKLADLQAAVAAVRKINPEQRSKALLTPALFLIRKRYRLTDLSVVKETGGSITIHAAVNPEMMFDLPARKEAGSDRWISDKLLELSRTQLRMLRQSDTIDRVRTILAASFAKITGLPAGSWLEVVAESDGRGVVRVHMGGDPPRVVLVGRVIPPNEGFVDIPNPDPLGVALTARHIRTGLRVVKDARGAFLGPKVIRDLSMDDARRLAKKKGIEPAAPGSRATMLQHTEGLGSDYISTSRVKQTQHMRSGTRDATGAFKRFFNPKSGRVKINLFRIPSSRIFDLSNRVGQEHWGIFVEGAGPAQQQAILDTIRTMEVLIKGDIPPEAIDFLEPPTLAPADDEAPIP